MCPTGFATPTTAVSVRPLARCWQQSMSGQCHKRNPADPFSLADDDGAIVGSVHGDDGAPMPWSYAGWVDTKFIELLVGTVPNDG